MTQFWEMIKRQVIALWSSSPPIIWMKQSTATSINHVDG